MYLKYINIRLLKKNRKIIFWRDIFSVEEDSENIEEEDSEDNNGEVKTEDKNELNNELKKYNKSELKPLNLKYEEGPYVSCEYNTIHNILSKSFGVINDKTTKLYHWYGNTEIYIIHHKQFSHFRDKNSFKNIIFINNDIPDEELEKVTNNLKKRNIVLESLDNWIEKMFTFINKGKSKNVIEKVIENDVIYLFKKRKNDNLHFYECGCVLESISTNANNNGGYKRRKKLKRRKKTKKKLKRRKKTKKKDKKRKNKKRKQKKTKHKKKRKRKTKRV